MSNAVPDSRAELLAAIARKPRTAFQLTGGGSELIRSKTKVKKMLLQFLCENLVTRDWQTGVYRVTPEGAARLVAGTV